MSLTKKQVNQMFVQEVMPAIRKLEAEYKTGRYTKDISMRCEEYNNFVDSLSKDRQITSKQAEKFCIPAYLIK
jgi:tRNA A37 N6-isopentenylltransferase MiaA